MEPGGDATVLAGPRASGSGRSGRSTGRRARRDAGAGPFRARSRGRAAAGGCGAARRGAVARGPRALRGACAVAAEIGRPGLGHGTDRGDRGRERTDRASLAERSQIVLDDCLRWLFEAAARASCHAGISRRWVGGSGRHAAARNITTSKAKRLHLVRGSGWNVAKVPPRRCYHRPPDPAAPSAVEPVSQHGRGVSAQFRKLRIRRFHGHDLVQYRGSGRLGHRPATVPLALHACRRSLRPRIRAEAVDHQLHGPTAYTPGILSVGRNAPDSVGTSHMGAFRQLRR